MENKLETTTRDGEISTEVLSTDLELEDRAVMLQMGKKQQLKRRFNYISILALSVTLLSSWEALGTTMGAGLSAGGPATLVWGFLLTFSGTLALAASIAEMASMCPISGAQYHWTYMFAPPKWRVPITFIQGWVTCFAWQATITSLTFLLAAQIQGLVVLNWPNYIFERWHTTLMMWGLLLLAYVINLWAVRILPVTELFAGVCHILFFFILAIVMIVLGHRNGATAEFVFTTFSFGGTGWRERGVNFFIGLLPGVWCVVGFDGAIHLSEETTKSATTIPQVIITTVLINGIFAFLFLLLLLFGISDISAALSTPTGYPLIEIFRQITRSNTAATLMEAAVLVIGIAAEFGTLASVSRLTWAFARDKGLPFSDFFAHVDSRYKIPTRSISLVSVVIILLSLINIGSTVAFNALLSLSTIGLYVSYIIPISCLLHKRLRVGGNTVSSAQNASPDKAYVRSESDPETIVFGPFSLGRFGPAINLYALCYACVMVPFMALPTVLPVTAASMNYAGPVFALVLVLAGADYVLRGRKRFRGPRREVG